jgi:hypothetical protein
VVVGDDHVEAEARGLGDLGGVADAAVDGDQQAHAVGGELGHGEVVEAVALAGAVGDVGADVAAHGADRLNEQGHRGDPVGVEVAVDGHGLAPLDGLGDAGAGLGHALHGQGVVEAAAVVGLEEGPHGVGVALLPLVEQVGDERADAEAAGEVGGRGVAEVPALIVGGEGSL